MENMYRPWREITTVEGDPITTVEGDPIPTVEGDPERGEIPRREAARDPDIYLIHVET